LFSYLHHQASLLEYHGLLFIQYTYGQKNIPRVYPPNYLEEEDIIDKWMDASKHKEKTIFQSETTKVHIWGGQLKATMVSYSSNTIMVTIYSQSVSS
jgi:hypothetical protein